MYTIKAGNLSNSGKNYCLMRDSDMRCYVVARSSGRGGRRFESSRPDHLKQWVTVDAVAHFLFGLAFGMALVIVYQLLDL